jgi:hypothetical protein
VTGVSPLAWSTLGLSVLVVVITVVLIARVTRGHVSVSIPWGRTSLPLAERTLQILAPRDLAVATLRSAARGTSAPVRSGEWTVVLDEEGGLIVNASLTRSRYGGVRAIELVRVEAERVRYRHLGGPLPGTEEEFLLTEEGGHTTVSYRGNVPVSFWGLGRLVARVLILPEYNRLVALHMDVLKRSCEVRAARARSRGQH